MDYWIDQFATHEKLKNGVNTKYITSSQSSEIVSILSAGTFFGALSASPAGDMLGRRLGLVSSTIVFTFGVILQTASTAIPLFVAGRFFAGFGVGMLSALGKLPLTSNRPPEETLIQLSVPLYQSETAPKWIRGAVVGAYQLAITIGLLIAAVVDNATQNRTDTGSYRIPIAVQFAWALVLFSGMLLLPETPRYCIKSRKPEKAVRSLSRLRRLDIDHPAIVEELAEIQANHEYELSLGKATYRDCLKGNLKMRIATGCLLQALQQLTGVNFVFYYVCWPVS